jgi:hypothetical protein
MSFVVHAAPVALPPSRFGEPIALAQSDPGSSGFSVPGEAGLDGHLPMSAFLALYLMLIEEMQKHRAANQRMSTQAGLLEQSISRAQAQHVRDQGTHILAGAVAGAVLGFGLGAAGAVMSHRAFGKQAGAAAPLERSRSARLTRGGDDGISPLARPPRNNLSELEALNEQRTLDDLVLGSPRRASAALTEHGPLDDLVLGSPRRAPAALTEHGPLDDLVLGSPRRAPAALTEHGPLDDLVLGSPRRASVAPTEHGALDDLVIQRNSPASAAPDAPVTPDSPVPPGPLRQMRNGMMGQMMLSNAALLAGVATAAGGMVAASDGADAGMLQTAGSVLQSTKHNRGEAARADNEGVTRIGGALHDQDQDLRQTISQIASSIRA